MKQIPWKHTPNQTTVPKVSAWNTPFHDGYDKIGHRSNKGSGFMPGWLTVVVLYIVNLVILVCVAVTGSRKPAATLTWILVSLIVPFVGPVVFFVTRLHAPRRPVLPWESARQSRSDESCSIQPHGHNQVVDSPTSNDFTQEPLSTSAVVARSIRHFSSPPIAASIRSYHSGTELYRDLIADLYQAERSIDLEFYIFRYDEVGKEIVKALLDRAKAGVQVRFLRDGFGSKAFPESVVDELQQAGADCRIHFPLRFPFLTSKVNHRDHCKIVIIDETVAFTGGMNVGREYAGLDPSYGPWRDTHVRIAAAVSLPLQQLFEANFGLAEPGPSKAPHHSIRLQAALTARQQESAGHANTNSTGNQGVVQFLESGPDTPRQNLRELFFICITQATKQVEVTTPYFLPESDLLMALCTAVSRGVRVRLLLPESVDHQLIGLACQTYFPQLLNAGVEIYLHRPGVLHAKVMTIDDQLAIVGAANYDLRSFRLNYEVVMVQYGEQLVQELRAQFERDLQVSRQLERHQLHDDFVSRIKHSAARLLAPLM